MYLIYIAKALSLMTPIALLLALCVHAFFTSLALGLEKTVSGAFFLVIAILAHKTGESISLVRSKNNFNRELV